MILFGPKNKIFKLLIQKKITKLIEKSKKKIIIYRL